MIARRVEKEVGDVSIIVNNAGIMPAKPLLDHDPEEIEKIFKINVFAHFWIIKAFLPRMLQNNKGHIVALSSCAGLMGFRNLVPYCGSKFAVRGFMEALYEETGFQLNSQIKYTVIYPYMVDTGLCKKPRIRFAKLMPLLSPKYVAEYIVDAQRKDVTESTIPGYIYYLNLFGRWARLNIKFSLKSSNFSLPADHCLLKEQRHSRNFSTQVWTRHIEIVIGINFSLF